MKNSTSFATEFGLIMVGNNHFCCIISMEGFFIGC